MIIYGTKLEIKMTRDGDLLSNIENPSLEKVVIDKSLGISRYNILKRMLTICKKRSDDKYLAKRAMITLAFSTTEDLKSLGFGTTWNFKSIITDADIYEYTRANIIHSDAIAIEDTTSFTHSEVIKKTRTRKNRTPKINYGAEETVSTKTFDLEALKDSVDKLINFFSEFDFEPNFRFINTLSRNCNTKTSAKKYIHNYFSLIDSHYINEIDEKMKSIEFESIFDGLSAQITEKTINKRLKIYYGSQGTGKTTKACEEADNCVIVCNNSMLPADLMQDFDFDNGKAAFKSSALYNAIVNGKTIVLDEINLLPFESLRFLQGIVDGKSSFIYKDKEVKIADGFKIIGTMNLFVNGMAYALPSPLVDRCEEITEFKLTANDLIYAIA